MGIGEGERGRGGRGISKVRRGVGSERGNDQEGVQRAGTRQVGKSVLLVCRYKSLLLLFSLLLFSPMVGSKYARARWLSAYFDRQENRLSFDSVDNKKKC